MGIELALPVDHYAASGAAAWAEEETVDFSDFSALAVDVELSAQFFAPVGVTGTWSVYLGGTAETVDGTLIGSVVRTGTGSWETVTTSWPLANPGTSQRVKLVGAGAGGEAEINSGSITLSDVESTPQIASIDPANGEGNVALTADVVITFDSDMDPASITTGNITLTANGSAVTCTVAYADRVATLSHAAALPINALCVVSISSAVRDTLYGSLEATTSTFVTDAPVETGAIDYTAQAFGRLLKQYNESSKLKAMIEVLADCAQEIETDALAVDMLDGIDTATGVNLDVIGEVVGQGRALINGASVNDATYRVLIRARIARNHARGDAPGFEELLSFILGGAVVWCEDCGGMRIAVTVTRELTADEESVLSGDILPRPMGVQIDPRAWIPSTATYFGFPGQPGSPLQFYPLGGDPATGGIFSRLF